MNEVTAASPLHTDPAVARSVGPGVVAVYADLLCPWATIVLERLRRRRDALGLDVMIDIRPFPLEVVNEGPVPFDVHVAGVEAAATVDPDYGFSPWDGPEGFAVTSLLPLEAVRSAYAQSFGAAEAFDAALRRAFFVDHECISLLPVVLDVADRCDGVDAADIEQHLRSGHQRPEVFEHLDTARELGAEGSPHVFLADGTSRFLPSLEIEPGEDGITVTKDDPSEIDELLQIADQTLQRD